MLPVLFNLYGYKIFVCCEYLFSHQSCLKYDDTFLDIIWEIWAMNNITCIPASSLRVYWQRDLCEYYVHVFLNRNERYSQCNKNNELKCSKDSLYCTLSRTKRPLAMTGFNYEGGLRFTPKVLPKNYAFVPICDQ